MGQGPQDTLPAPGTPPSLGLWFLWVFRARAWGSPQGILGFTFHRGSRASIGPRARLGVPASCGFRTSPSRTANGPGRTAVSSPARGRKPPERVLGGRRPSQLPARNNWRDLLPASACDSPLEQVRSEMGTSSSWTCLPGGGDSRRRCGGRGREAPGGLRTPRAAVCREPAPGLSPLLCYSLPLSPSFSLLLSLCSLFLSPLHPFPLCFTPSFSLIPPLVLSLTFLLFPLTPFLFSSARLSSYLPFSLLHLLTCLPSLPHTPALSPFGLSCHPYVSFSLSLLIAS